MYNCINSNALEHFSYIDKTYKIEKNGDIINSLNRPCSTFIRYKNRKETALVLKNKKIKKFFIDELVALKYVPAKSNLHSFLIHIDGDNSNNNSDNLAWVTREEEFFHYYKNNEPEYDIWNIINGWCSPLPGMYSYENAKIYNYLMPMCGYEGRYLVDTYGNMYNLLTNRILKKYVNRKGYIECRISIDGIPKTMEIHRLIAKTFIPNDKPFTNNTVGHVDENKLNNHVSNLEWVTNEENINRYYKNNNKNKYVINGLTFNNLVEASEYIHEEEKKIAKFRTKPNIRSGIKSITTGQMYNPLYGRYTVELNGVIFPTKKEKYDLENYQPVYLNGQLMKNRREFIDHYLKYYIITKEDFNRETVNISSMYRRFIKLDLKYWKYRNIIIEKK